MIRYAISKLLPLATLTLVIASAAAQQPTAAGERRATQAFSAARADQSSPLALRAFLAQMPKGADLHMHLSGAVYAETFLRDAVNDKLCVDPKALTLVKNSGASEVCPAGDVSAASVFHNQRLYDSLVDAFSMRGFVPSASVSGHDQFFATFDRFSALGSAHAGEWLNEVATRAAAQNEQYLEVMQTPSFFELAPLWTKLGWPLRGTMDASRVRDPADHLAPEFEGDVTGTSSAELDTLRTELLAGGLGDEIALDIKEFDEALAARARIEHCGQPSAAPACGVKIRFLYQVLRAFPPEQVFAQTLLAFEVVSVDANVVGLNFVQPEDAALSMSEYNRQMRMLDYLHRIYPKVHVSLHAGELAPGLVPPDGLRFHIREAVELGHAERIGHGVDIMYETNPRGLLQEMAARHVMVEINLTSNDAILGVTAPHHPLPIYRAAQVPVALSTDDEGVARSDLTNEFVRAATEYNLNYLDLKSMARASLEHSFLPGESLWAKPDEFTRAKPACAGQSLGAASPTPACATLLKSSERAAAQWELERRFSAFESSLP
jgi:adenosine deaminase